MYEIFVTEFRSVQTPAEGVASVLPAFAAESPDHASLEAATEAEIAAVLETLQHGSANTAR